MIEISWKTTHQTWRRGLNSLTLGRYLDTFMVIKSGRVGREATKTQVLRLPFQHQGAGCKGWFSWESAFPVSMGARVYSPKFTLQSHICCYTFVVPVWGKTTWADHWGSLTSQLSLTDKFQATGRPYLQKQKKHLRNSAWAMIPKIMLWSSFTSPDYTCIHMHSLTHVYTHAHTMHTHVHVCKHTHMDTHRYTQRKPGIKSHP